MLMLVDVLFRTWWTKCPTRTNKMQVQVERMFTSSLPGVHLLSFYQPSHFDVLSPWLHWACWGLAQRVHSKSVATGTVCVAYAFTMHFSSPVRVTVCRRVPLLSLLQIRFDTSLHMPLLDFLSLVDSMCFFEEIWWFLWFLSTSSITFTNWNESFLSILLCLVSHAQKDRCLFLALKGLFCFASMWCIVFLCRFFVLVVSLSPSLWNMRLSARVLKYVFMFVCFFFPGSLK